MLSIKIQFLVLHLLLGLPPSILDSTGIANYDGFLMNFKKDYNETETIKRKKIFNDNIKIINNHNELYELGEKTHKMGLNKFSDMTYEEVIAISYTGLRTPTTTGRRKRSYDYYVPRGLGQEPRSYKDYREEGAVNPIRHQGQCNSSFAFSVIASIESNFYLKQGGSPPQLSEKELVDCTTDDGCKGEGGYLDKSMKYIKDNGISYEDDYAYELGQAKCRNTSTKFKEVIDYKMIRPGNDADLLDALVNEGPVAISFHISRNFLNYRSGIITDGACFDVGIGLNHAMTLVGYGTDYVHSKGKYVDYWLIRNSWGVDWGEEGYFKLNRNIENHCLISSSSFIPIIKDKNGNFNGEMQQHRIRAVGRWTDEIHGCIEGFNGVTKNGITTMATCQRQCEMVPECKSVEWMPSNGECVLSRMNIHSKIKNFQAPCKYYGWKYSEKNN